MGYLNTLLNSDGFMPHGHCVLWTPGLLWLSVVSDALRLADLTIAIPLVYFVQKTRDIPFNGMFGAFGALILACGATQVVDVLTTWDPAYWLPGFNNAITAGVSVLTAIFLVTLVPRARLILSELQLTKVNVRLQTK